MKDEQDYIRDITEMRSLMERSSKFMSLSGVASIAAGIYALTGAFIIYKFFPFDPGQVIQGSAQPGTLTPELQQIIWIAIVVLISAISTAIYLSGKKAAKRREKFLSPSAIRLVKNMAVPLITGALLLVILVFKGIFGLLAPLTLIFYGLALYNAGNITYKEVKSLGLIDIGLGLIGTYYWEYGFLLWVLGFGVVHIIYGIYIHYRYEK